MSKDPILFLQPLLNYLPFPTLKSLRLNSILNSIMPDIEKQIFGMELIEIYVGSVAMCSMS